MGLMFLLSGVLLLVFANTDTGYKYRWQAITLYLLLLIVVQAYQVHKLNGYQFSNFKAIALLKN